jgi:hypothetical protein
MVGTAGRDRDGMLTVGTMDSITMIHRSIKVALPDLCVSKSGSLVLLRRSYKWTGNKNYQRSNFYID